VTPDPPDQAVRVAATTQLDTTLFVEAGAGTGKTTMLVDRVVALVSTKTARMDQIAAITFTEAAAAELRDRLAQKFESLATDDPEDPVSAAVNALDASAVTTLHGFSRKILAEQPFAVGLPPLFEVADASSSRVAFDERWGRFVNELLGDPVHEDMVVRALSCGMTWERLRVAALACEENWDLLEDQVETPALPPPLKSQRLVDLLRQAVDLRTECSDSNDTLFVHLTTRTVPILTLIGQASGEIDLLQILSGTSGLRASKAGRKENWTTSSVGVARKEDVLSLLREAESERVQLIDQTVQWVLTRLFGAINSFTLDAAAERRSSGRLAFHDLLVLARQLVRDHPTARAELHDRYTHILIDEFQDTDPIQAELAMYLAAGRAADATGSMHAEWEDLPIPPGRLFFVGDPKQSIYRFRRADINLFMKVKDRVVGDALPLTTNFRSRPGIVAWVNAVFGGVFGQGEPGKQPNYVPLEPFEDHGRDNERGLAPVIVLGSRAMNDSADGVRAAQANDIVAAIATMHAEGWLLGDPAQPLRYADVAVLVRTRTGLPILEEAFRTAGVPYQLESSSLVYESDEVQQLLATLRAIDDPTDALSVLATLRSPGFGCGDDDLYAHHAAGGGWDPRSVPTDLHGPVADALGVLGSYHDMRWWSSVGALVSQVVADRHLMSLALADDRPRETWRRIRFLMDQARLFDESNGGDLRAFLRWTNHQSEDGARVTEAILPESDDDAVRISTVHAAKGLEFPVTILLGLQTGQNSQRAPLLFGPQGRELCLKKGIETPGYDACLQEERQMELFEQQRLLYVAATRARDVLIVSVHRNVATKLSLATQVVEQCERCPDLWSDGSELCLTPELTRSHPSAELGSVTPDDEQHRAAFERERVDALSRAAVPRTIAATGVRRLAEMEEPVESGLTAQAGEELLQRPDSSAVQHRGRAGTAIGRAVHAVLQLIDLSTGENLPALAAVQAAAEGVPERTSEVRQLVQAALDSDLVHQAVASDRYWREVYVGVPVGERVLEGFIDLLFETPEGLAVVDYKTDRLSDQAGPGDIASRYRLQGASYAVAVREALGKPVFSCSFLILGQHGATVAPLEDLALAMTEVEKILHSPVL
jgi:ATP-dependent helicase/nuclease subunit A